MSFKFSSKDNLSDLHPNIVHFVPRYIKNRKDDYEKLKQAVEDRDYEAMRDYCHKVVGTARSYHFFQLEEITLALQGLVRNQEIEGILELMPSYDAYIRGLFLEYLSDKD